MTGHSTASLAMGRATSDAVALSGVIRDVVSMGEERLVLMLRLSSLPPARRTNSTWWTRLLAGGLAWHLALIHI